MSKLRASIDLAEQEMRDFRWVGRERVKLLVEEIESYLSESMDVLERVESYFEKCADADCDQDGHIPNEEMQLLVRVQEVIKQA